MIFSKFIKRFSYIAAVLLIAISSYGVIEGYHLSKQPSTIETELTNLGFSTPQQNALLTIWAQAGYLTPDRVRHDLNAIKVANPQRVFNELNPILQKANVNDPAHFNSTILLKNFFKEVEHGKSNSFTKEDVVNYIIYVSQYAFDRKVGQERNELTQKNWMTTYAEQYMANAKILGLVDEIKPSLKEYDGAWIAGASRVGVMARIIHLEYMLDKYNLLIKHTPLILAGARPIWANIDGISPDVYDKLMQVHKSNKDINSLDVSVMVGDLNARIIEGMDYMRQLAVKNNITLQPKPFVVYTDQENSLSLISSKNQLIEYLPIADMPKGLYLDRIYANYADVNSPKLTETLMSYDLLEQLIGHSNSVHIIDTAEEEGNRPTTASTARDVAKIFIEQIKHNEPKEYHILYVSNNPYIERQALSTQYEVNRLLHDGGLAEKGYKITVNGVGFRNKQDVATTNSELAILVLEKTKMYLTEQGTKKLEEISLKIPLKDLLYQTRDHYIETPDLLAANLTTSDNFFNNLYHEWVIIVRDYFDSLSE